MPPPLRQLRQELTGRLRNGATHVITGLPEDRRAELARRVRAGRVSRALLQAGVGLVRARAGADRRRPRPPALRLDRRPAARPRARRPHRARHARAAGAGGAAAPARPGRRLLRHRRERRLLHARRRAARRARGARRRVRAGAVVRAARSGATSSSTASSTRRSAPRPSARPTAARGCSSSARRAGRTSSPPAATPTCATRSTSTVVSIDSLVASGAIPPPDVMKIDTEGAELQAIDGARETIARHRPAIVCELHDTNAGVRRAHGRARLRRRRTSTGRPPVAGAGPVHALAQPRG